jgi:hypothetical protein
MDWVARSPAGQILSRTSESMSKDIPDVSVASIRSTKLILESCDACGLEYGVSTRQLHLLTLGLSRAALAPRSFDVRSLFAAERGGGRTG